MAWFVGKHAAYSPWIRATLEWLKSQEARGELAIRAWLGRSPGTQKVERGRNEGDVIGVAPWVGPRLANYSAVERKTLLELARRALLAALTDADAAELTSAELPEKLAEKKGCFVTLTRGDSLRGCYGNLQPQMPLYQVVAVNTHNAALRDPRFPKVSVEEMPEIDIKISVLTLPQCVYFDSPEELLAQLRPLEHGVWLRLGLASATFLPQVWSRIPDKIEFMDRLAEKAGMEPSAWRGKDAAVSVYRAESFGERTSEPA
jgi:AmmeMemoRadiSam system protein A